MDIIINQAESTLLNFYEFVAAVSAYRGSFRQRYHLIDTTELLANEGKLLEITVTNFGNPKRISFSHRFLAPPDDTKPRIIRSRLIVGERRVQAVQRTDIAASIDEFGNNTRIVFQLFVNSFEYSIHEGKYIAAARDVNGDLFLGIFNYDWLWNELPIADPPRALRVLYGMTPSCGVKIPGGGS